MSPRSKREYVEAVFLRYKQANKLARGFPCALKWLQ